MKRSTILTLHLSFWFLIGLLLYAIFAPLLKINEFAHGEAIRNLESILPAIVVAIVSIFYTAYFATPFFLKRKKRIYFLIASILVLAVGYALKCRYIDNNLAYIVNTIGVFTPPLILAFIGGVFRTVIELWKNKVIKTQLEKEQLFTQLQLLKAKIDPHFLFNSLNNIDVLIEENPKTASEYLTKLSDILRYVLYEAKDDDILLTKELEQITSFVGLQKIRTNNTSFVNLDIRGDANDRKIVPMIFLPFIENAFKHCKNKTVENAITIEFDIQPDSVTMMCKNYYTSKQSEIMKNDGLGIGIVKQRLNLLYPNSHELIIDKSEPWFTVTLCIKFRNGN